VYDIYLHTPDTVMTPLHIGIVACSAEGAALCYRTICVEGATILGPHAHSEVTVHTPSLADYMACIYRSIALLPTSSAMCSQGQWRAPCHVGQRLMDGVVGAGQEICANRFQLVSVGEHQLAYARSVAGGFRQLPDELPRARASISG
jgi:hypothetical protein